MSAPAQAEGLGLRLDPFRFLLKSTHWGSNRLGSNFRRPLPLHQESVRINHAEQWGSMLALRIVVCMLPPTNASSAILKNNDTSTDTHENKGAMPSRQIQMSRDQPNLLGAKKKFKLTKRNFYNGFFFAKYN
jgi:hypothetical protein